MSFIKKIRIKNFKNLEDVEIDVKPLTFLFGPNGSGKSSFIKAILFLYKNIFPINSNRTIYKLENNLNLGSYEDIVSKNVGENIVFEMFLEGEMPFIDNRVFDMGNNKDFSEKKLWEKDMIFTNYLEREDVDNYINKLNENFFSTYSQMENSPYYDENEFKEIFEELYDFSFKFTVIFKYEKSGKNLNKIIIEDLINKSFLEYNIQEPSGSFSGFRFYEESYNCNAQLLNHEEYCNFYLSKRFSHLKNNFCGNFDFPFIPTKDDFVNGDLHDLNLASFAFKNNELQKEKAKAIKGKWLKKSITERIQLYTELLKFTYHSIASVPKFIRYFLDSRHLPTIREVPKIKYLLTENEFDKNEYYDLLNILFTEQGITKQTKGEVSAIEKINSSLSKLEFNKTISIEKNTDIGSIFLIDNNNRKFNLSNESSGLIQILPIIISINIKNDGALTLIEQPELHLHPRLQSLLANVFSKIVNEEDNIKTLIIETHSEHLIRKIQVLIANGELDREKVSVLYFDNKNGSTKVEEMKLDEKGLFIKDWPDGFFDDSINLTMELYEALRKNKN